MVQLHSTFEIDTLLRKVAKPQDGLITVAQAEMLGVDRHALLRRRRAGALVPMFDGVMRLAAAPPSSTRRILAASLAVPGSTVAGPSAAIVHDMPVPRRLLATSRDVVLCVDAGRRIRRSGIEVVRLETALRSAPWMISRLATPSATLVLLANYVGVATQERCLDACLGDRTVSVASVQEALDAIPPQMVGPGNALEQLLADRSDGLVGHRSGLEQKVRGWLDDAGLGGWASNYRVPLSDGEEVESGLRVGRCPGCA